MESAAIRRAAELIHQADGMLITAGAGMGVDSGLPDFRGEGGFWQHYPGLDRAGIGFTEIACPEAFRTRPRLAWGFYGHRLRLYRDAEPHGGFGILRRWGTRMAQGTFSFTSNVDGQFQKAGFPDDRICEVHGSIHHLQCLDVCTDDLWSSEAVTPQVDEEACLLTSPMPACPHCGGIARPNILMFSDWEWLPHRSQAQASALHLWRQQVSRPVVVEIGAGRGIPTVRKYGEGFGAPLIRINPRDSEVPVRADAISLPMEALEALRAIDEGLA